MLRSFPFSFCFTVIIFLLSSFSFSVFLSRYNGKMSFSVAGFGDLGLFSSSFSSPFFVFLFIAILDRLSFLSFCLLLKQDFSKMMREKHTSLLNDRGCFYSVLFSICLSFFLSLHEKEEGKEKKREMEKHVQTVRKRSIGKRNVLDVWR